MMYNVKGACTPSKKNQEKNVQHTKNSNPAKIEDKKDILDKMVVKSSKSEMNSETSLTPNKIKDNKLGEHSDHQTNQMKAIDKHSDKRKDEKVSPQKKLKTDNSAKISELSTESLPVKKTNKFKSMFPKTYICKYCCRRFHSVEQLKQHSNSEHAGKPSHVCHLCSHQAASFSALMTHYLKHSGNKRDNIEKIYAKSKADFSNLQLNMSSRPKSSIQCTKCDLNFSSKAKYNAHNCSNIPQKSEYNCAYCRHVSITIEDYRNHIQSHSETPFTCSYCKHKAMTKKQYDTHRETCKVRLKLKVNYKCEKCNEFSTKIKKEFNEHGKNCKINKLHTCVKCDLKFDDEKCYEEHLLICNKSDDKKAKKSNNIQKPGKKKFKRRRKMKESVADKNKLLCCVCDCVCYSKSEYEEHERQCLAEMANDSLNKVSANVSSVCEETDENRVIEPDKSCHSKNDIKMEEMSPVDDPNSRRSRRLVRRKSSCNDREGVKKPKPLKIKIEKKPKIPKLLMKPRFRKGRQSKNANNPFLCNYCDFTFCSKSTLLRHKRMHSGNPWYICQFCGKFFFRKDVYIRHEVNVHKNISKNMFCCYYCKLCFSDTVMLKEHVEAAHKKSAFLPIKHNVSDKDDEDSPVKRDVIIKNEKDDDLTDVVKNNITCETTVNSSLMKSHVENNSTSKFKCSECFEFFESALDIEIHMQTHAKFSFGSACNKVSKSANNHDKQKRSLTKKEKPPLSRRMPKIKKINKNKEMIGKPFKIPSVLPEIKLDNTSTCFGDTNETSYNKASNIDKLDSNSSICASELPQSLECKLCSKCFSNKNLLEEHNNITHKIIDWYQCLVCSASGPKREILEHMLTHTYKVGSYVISDAKDYDTIISSIQNDNQKKTVEKNPNISIEKQNTNLSNDINFELEDKLPPLKEYGLCSCFDKIFEQEKETCASTSSIEGSAAELEQIKNVETSKCFETACDFSENNNERKVSLTESINLSVDNTSTSLNAQNTNDPCDDVFQEEISKSEETAGEIQDCAETSSNVKIDFGSVENSLDCNQTESFSQLRYLLQSPNSKHSVENKTPLYSFPQLQIPNIAFDKQNSPLKASSQDSFIPDMASATSNNDSNFTLDLSTKSFLDLPKSDINLVPPKQNLNSSEISIKTSIIQDNNQSNNTCLKFDINQSRCEFSENVNYAKDLSTSNQNCTEVEKNENLFKTCPNPNPILDFSDLIQHSFENSSPSDDNIFSYSVSKQVDPSLNISMREEVRTPDCTDMMNFDSSEFTSSLKCQKCNVLLLDLNDKLNHKCSSLHPDQSIDIDLFSHYKPKNTFYPLPNIENQNKNVSLGSDIEKRGKAMSPEKPAAAIFVCSMCSKVLPTETELAKHQKSDHAQTLHSSHSCECTKCHRTFADIGELMKHSLTCLRTLFLKSTSVNDCLSSPDSLQSFLKKEETKTNFPSLSFNNIPTDFSRQTSENLLKRSFNS